MTSNPAGELAQALTVHLPPSWDVEGYAVTPDNLTPGCPVVRVFRRRFQHSPFLGRYSNEMELWLIDEHTDEREADDSLSTRLDELADVLDELEIDWPEGAERGTFADKFHSYKITFTVLTERA